MEKNGRKNLKVIGQEVEGKKPEEVKAYHKVFWQKYKEINEYEKMIENIERGEERIKKQNEISETINDKVSQYNNPLLQLKINYPNGKGKYFTEEEDKFLVVMMDKYGYNNDDSYDKIRDEIRKLPQFRFNWFFKSRSPLEISRRCTFLVNNLLRERNEQIELEKIGKVINNRIKDYCILIHY
ncbi:slide-domain-containing protein [Neoconidiobolus thromboides FSU 785]|nr:slide-domain-containing protein [Neoconidiobolus thromboides FSU 785]